MLNIVLVLQLLGAMRENSVHVIAQKRERVKVCVRAYVNYLCLLHAHV